MSFNIIDQILKHKTLPGKYKRVLQAWASFARKDGTNAFPSKEAVAERAGISRWTVYENTDDLVTLGLLIPTGRKTYPSGHWTTVYSIGVEALEKTWDELMPLLENPTVVEGGHCSKTPKSLCSKTQKPTVVKPDAILPYIPSQAQGYDQTLVDPSDASRIGEVSKQVSEQGAQASLSLVIDKPLSEVEQEESLDQLKSEYPSAWNLMNMIHNIATDEKRLEYLKEAIVIVDWLIHVDSRIDPVELLKWNRSHKSGKLVIKSCRQFVRALVDSEDNILLNDYTMHDFSACKDCKRLGLVSPADRAKREAVESKAEPKREAERCACGRRCKPGSGCLVQEVADAD